MSKSKKSIEQIVAEEMNKVMMYGMNENGELSEPDEQIDLEMTDKNLAKEIAKRAKEDLRPDDKDSFSKKVWAYFEENDLLPADEEEAPEEPEELEDDEADEEPEEPKSKKKSSKREESEEPAPKKSKRDDDKSRTPREKGPSFEDIACQIVKKTPPKEAYEALTEKFTELYEARGKSDEDFIRKRVGIYYRIASQRLSVEMVMPSTKKVEKKGKEDSKKKSKRDD